MSAVNAERKRAPQRADGTPRDLTVTALILGVAGALWFGWGQPTEEAAYDITIVPSKLTKADTSPIT